MSNLYSPITVVINPANPAAGATVSVTVTLNGNVESNQAVAISSSIQGFFTNLPSSVTVVTNANSVTFNATLSSSAAGSASVTASCNGGWAAGAVVRPTPPPPPPPDGD